MGQIKNLTEYEKVAEDWTKRIRDYINVDHILSAHGFYLFSFLNKEYEEIFISEMQKEVCVFHETNLDLKVKIKTKYWVCITSFSNKEYYTEKEQDLVDAWFAVYYPGVDPWIDRKP